MGVLPATSDPHLSRLESEAIHLLREAVAESRKPVLLFSAGKDSTVLAHLALKAFHPAKPPFPLLNVDSTWEFDALLAFRDAFAHTHGFELIAYANEAGRAEGLNPFDHGDRYTTVMRTEALKQALDAGGYDIVFGGARRDEEKSRAKERVVSIRSAAHAWDPRQQRLELRELYNLRLAIGQSARVFPLSNWTELHVLRYALGNDIELAPLYFAAHRRVVERGGTLIMVDDERRIRLRPGDAVQMLGIRFCTLGCWPVTGAVVSDAADLAAVVQETLACAVSERSGRAGGEDGGSLEKHKRAGYF